MSPSARIISYWLITGLLLITVNVVINWLQKNQGQVIDHHVSAIDLTTELDIPRGRYYQIHGSYYVDMTGTTRMVLPVKTIPKHPGRYDTVVIKGLSSKPHINLYWQWQTPENRDSAPYKQQLNGYSQSINQLPTEWRNGSEIIQLDLIIEVDTTLGFVNNYEAEVAWLSIKLINHSDINPMQKLISELHSFVPLNFVSLNIHSSNHELVYRNLLIRIGFWLLLAASLYLILKPPAIHLLLTLLLAWLILTTVYGYNFSRQVASHSSLFADNDSSLNESDQRLHKIADQVNDFIENDGSQSGTAKIVIVGSDSFEKHRLNYYLLSHNTGVMNTLDDIQNNLQHNIDYAILLEPYLDWCNKQLNKDESVILKQLIRKTDYCLVRL